MPKNLNDIFKSSYVTATHLWKNDRQRRAEDTFKNCEGLSRVAFMDGNGVVMLGKVISCEQAAAGDKAGGKKK